MSRFFPNYVAQHRRSSAHPNYTYQTSSPLLLTTKSDSWKIWRWRRKFRNWTT